MMKTLYKISLLAAFCFCASGIFAQQAEREKAIELYKKSDYKGALNLLKKTSAANQTDAQSWYFLGLTYLKIGEEKNAVKALQKAVQIIPDNAQMRNGLAYAYLVKNDQSAAYREAQETIKLDPKMAESYYVLGVLSFRNASYNAAYENARRTIDLNPKIGPAYLLKSECLVASFTKQFGTVNKAPTGRSEMLKEAAQDLEKFLSLDGGTKETQFYREYLESIRFYADYYARTEVDKPKADDISAKPSNDKTAINIKSKPRASYTDDARRANISGTVTLLVGFDADGKIKHVLILNPLGYGLNEESVKAAQHITFEPATENGVPVSVVKQVQYSFTIY